MKTTISASAMKNGLILGLVFAVGFLSMLQAVVSEQYLLIYISFFCMIFSLVLAYRYAVSYRNKENNGVMRYGSAVWYIVLLYFFASILSGGVMMLYFKVIQPNFLTLFLENPRLQESLAMAASMQGVTVEQARENLNVLNSIPAFTLQYIWNNTFLGVIVGALMAIFIRKEGKDNVPMS